MILDKTLEMPGLLLQLQGDWVKSVAAAAVTGDILMQRKFASGGCVACHRRPLHAYAACAAGHRYDSAHGVPHTFTSGATSPYYIQTVHRHVSKQSYGGAASKEQ